jgi:phage antirepressor YoqD-like protein
MAPTTPPKNTQHFEHDTIKRARVFDAFDSKENTTSVREIARLPQINITPSTARTWLKKREILGDQAIRRTRKTSSRLGRKPKVSASDLQYLTN